jgi:hypothetical protein
MNKILRIALLLMAAHLIAWTISFLLAVGFAPELAASYFVMGWSFAGGETPALVWFFSWAIFVFILLGYFLLRMFSSFR